MSKNRVEPPYDCAMCRIEMADKLLDSVEGDITGSVATFIIAFNELAIKWNVHVTFVVAKVMQELHEQHGGEDA